MKNSVSFQVDPFMRNGLSRLLLIPLMSIFLFSNLNSQPTRLLRQPSISNSHITFTYGGDVWISKIDGSEVLRITSTPAVEKSPKLSPDGKTIAFTSNRSGSDAVYIVPIEGGMPKRLSWHPSSAQTLGWTPDGERVIYASGRDYAPRPIDRIWSVSKNGGPATLLSKQWATRGSFSPDGNKIAIERVNRWDEEWRAYRGGQNTPLIILDLEDHSEILLPNERTTDTHPVWIKDKIYFLSDRTQTMNIWSYSPETKQLEQISEYEGSDIKWLSGKDKLVFERDGYLHLMDPETKLTNRLEINITGDFPWAATKWEDVSKNIRAASISPTGKRAIFEARGEIFTVPAEHGDTRNMTESSGIADRAPLWSPEGDKIAWFSDAGGKKYKLLIAAQDGLSDPDTLSIGISKMAWEPVWSPDGKFIAFVDDDVRVRVLDLESEKIRTVDTAGDNTERGSMGLDWSPDSKYLAYARSGANKFRRIYLWSMETDSIRPVTNELANAFSPVWDRNKKHLYFLASTDYSLSSGWANTSSMTTDPEYAVYLINLQKDGPSPFELRSDEEKAEEEENGEANEDEDNKKKKGKKKNGKENGENPEENEGIRIDFENIGRRTIPLPMPERNYRFLVGGPEGSVFIAEDVPNKRGYTLHKFKLEDRELKEYASGIGGASISADGKSLLARANGAWKIMNAAADNDKGAKTLKVDLQMKLDRSEEWNQMFEEAWRYERDYFYDPGLHGRDWNVVYERYSPLVPYVKHRADLTYILDQVSGELSVGHSFVFGGDYPDTESSKVGLLGADLVPDNGRWKIKKIYTTESWNPNLTSPLDNPGVNIEEGYYLVGINGKELTALHNPYKMLDGTLNKQTVVHIHTRPEFEGSWQETIKPIRSESDLRQRAWVEDNRRLVDSLSNGKLAYVWIPNTGGPGLVSFNRYFFAQQDKQGAVIDERFNGGGLLDDYMVDLMTRSIRAAYTNEVPGGKPGILPAGILGPKVLLINEMAGSGGDFFPWVFRQQDAGPLIGMRTWGGLVKSSVHYPLIDGGALTAPDNAIFDPIKGEWIGENEGIPPDIKVRQDAKSLAEGRDPQLERAVEEALKLLEEDEFEIKVPEFPEPAKE